MISRPPGLIDANPWVGATPRGGEAGARVASDSKAPCQGCRHLFLRYGPDGPGGRPTCAQGVEYAQPGCVRSPRPEFRRG